MTRPYRLLIADDEPDILELVALNFAMEGFEVLTATDGIEAEELVRVEHPDVIILDIMMPGRDGWEVCRVMKQHPQLGKTVRVVMVTALSDMDDKREALKTGADDFVVKPFDFPTLVATVQRNLAMQRTALAS